MVDNKATEKSAGRSRALAVEQVIDRGYAVATIYYGDIDPDFDDGFKNGILALFPEGTDRGTIRGASRPGPGGSAGRLDYLGTDPLIDAKHVAVLGHSRLGKTSRCGRERRTSGSRS